LGNYRLYTQVPEQGWVIKQKYGFTFKDTYVNFANIEGMPRIVIATTHLQVKRQLEEMGL
jgi:hypothetical protein